jgi:hypothetical protein
MEKRMANLNPPILRKMRISILAALAVSTGILLPAGCTRAKSKPELTCSLLELRPNPASRYYDAVVRIESVTSPNPLKEQFQVITPSSAFDLSTLKFTVEGRDTARLEPGDAFIIPLKRPDWKFTVMKGDLEYCAERFWDRLPPGDRWHPTKTEAMDVARSIEIQNEQGLLKPVAPSLPPEWQLSEDKVPETENGIGSLIFQKIRGGRPVERVEVQYALLTEEQKARFTASSAADFLSTWSECIKKGGVSADIAGHNAIACDLEGVGEFGWTYRYLYVTSNVVVAIDVQSDPEEFGKTEQEKEQERRTEQIFFRYGYGPVGKEGWQVMIEARMNRTGAFHKRSRSGDSLNKDFNLSDGEFAAIEKALADNHFPNLESRSSLGPGFESFIAVRSATGAHTVTMKNAREPLFENIASTIRGIVLPKVDENGMQPAAR